MLDPISVVVFLCLYVGTLFGVAIWTERRTKAGSIAPPRAALGALASRVSASPTTYALSLAVYCTSWTYYGSVGNVTQSGLLYMTVHLGPTLGMFLFRPVLRKMVRIKTTHRITSIADFVSARYDRSQAVAAVATVVALVGMLPYIALQLRAIMSTFSIISTSGTQSLAHGAIRENIGPLIVVLMCLFTIMFGVRRIDPTERHRGIIAAVAFESIVKLLAFLAVGIFVVWRVFDGPGELISALQSPEFAHCMAITGDGASGYVRWTTYLLLATAALFFLPRQFHVAAIENSNERHIESATWMFPLYLILINLFVVPIAIAGLKMGIPTAQADSYVLRLPLDAGHGMLALAAFLGGFSAATSMVMIESMTLATMLTNHLLLPLVHSYLPRLRGHVLQLRWISVAVCIVASYGFERLVGESFRLIGIGIISFAAALQFAPSILFGLFWPRASKQGAIAGLAAGFLTWIYTLFLPAVMQGSFLGDQIIQLGPAGIGWLRPQALFGLDVLPAISHSVFWSLLFNVGLLVVVSLRARQTIDEQRNALSFVDPYAAPLKPRVEDMTLPQAIGLRAVRERLQRALAEVLNKEDGRVILDASISVLGLLNKREISILEASELVGEVEKCLAGSLGAATAYRIIRNAHLFTPAETEALKHAYSEIVARMNVSPDELLRKVDHYRERGKLLAQHARELENKVRERDTEIAQRRRVEGALRAAEEKYRSIFENAVEGIFQATLEGHIISANPALARIFGHSTATTFIEASGSRPEAIFVEEAALRAFLGRVEQEGNVTGAELRCRRQDGELIWVTINGRLVTRDGASAIIEGSIEDVTERRRAEQALRQSEKRYRDLFENASDLVQITDMSGHVLYANRAWRESVGFDPAGEAPVTYADYVHEESRFVWDEAFRRLRAGDDVPQFETLFVTRTGRAIYVEGTLNARIEQGSPTATRGIFRDITERKAVDRMKSEFISVVSHELRTPLTSVKGSLGLLEGGVVGKLSDRGLQMVQIARSNADRLIRLVNDILDLEKIEAGKSDLQLADVPSREIVSRTFEGLQGVAAEAKVALRQEDDDDFVFRGDRDRLVQVLTNLVDNAIKFSPEGGTVRVSARLGEDGLARFAVSDSGPGIPSDKRASLFQKFHQLDASDSRRKGGTGLGLAICKAIVEQHGGHIDVVTGEAGGATFYFTLPARLKTAPALPAVGAHAP